MPDPFEGDEKPEYPKTTCPRCNRTGRDAAFAYLADNKTVVCRICGHQFEEKKEEKKEKA